MINLKPKWPLLPQEELFKILLSFAIIGFAGGLLNWQFQKQSWERQVRYELFKNELEDGRKILSDITTLIDQRLFTAQQFIWAVKDSNSNIATDSWQSYMEAVNKWNINDELLQSKLAQMSGHEIASQFLTYDDDLNNEIPKSIHYKFYRIHQHMLSLRQCYYSLCNYQKDLAQLDKLISALIDQETRLLGDLNDNLNGKYKKLKLSPSGYLKQEI